MAPITGFFRNGCCDTGPDDTGMHTVCAVMTTEFLAYSKLSGNDLSTPRPESGFPGLSPGIAGACASAAGVRRETPSRAPGGPGRDPRGGIGRRDPRGPRTACGAVLTWQPSTNKKVTPMSSPLPPPPQARWHAARRWTDRATRRLRRASARSGGPKAGGCSPPRSAPGSGL